MVKSVAAQYGLAGVTLVCAVTVNIFGKETEALNTLFSTVIAASLWGGLQRQRAEVPETGGKEKPR